MAEIEKESELLKRSLQAITWLEKKLAQKEKPEPIAVVGMACRLPGGCNTPEAFWDLLREGRSGICEIPRTRWEVEAYYDPDGEATGKMYVKQGGFLTEDLAEFDARFFGISPREAGEMDPQQRLLLEVSWEALERAGVGTRDLKGSATGVFLGISGSEYATLPRNPEQMGPYTATGVAANVASGRISHLLGLHGPAISVDTACSSSLVAVHLACRSLSTGECDLALAGGVNLLLAPESFIMLCKIKALSQDGKCKTFAADADGYVRAEGCGMVVLKRLSQAIADGDHVIAVIRGSAVNQDGPSSGLTVPNGLAQQQLLQKALENSGVLPEEVDYLEAHGTGTSLGDPIEVQAISEVFGGKRPPEKPLILGAVKSNIGHLEAAAGIASLIKVLLCLEHKQIPPNLHLKSLNPGIKLEKIPALVPVGLIPWESNGKARISGISSFGFSGTNVHLVVGEAPAEQGVQPDAQATVVRDSIDRPCHIMALSAQETLALHKLSESYLAFLEHHPQYRIADICHTGNGCRFHWPHRIAVIATHREQMIKDLQYFREGCADTETVFSGSLAEGKESKLAFFFSGAWETMAEAGRILYETQPFFRKSFDSCRKLFQSLGEITPLEETLPWDSRQPVAGEKAEEWSFCLGLALAQLLDAWGIRPTAVWGEGSGLFAAAVSAGIMPLETAVVALTQLNRKASGDFSGFEKLQGAKLRLISNSSGAFAENPEYAKAKFWQQRTNTPEIMEKGIQNLVDQGYQHLITLGSGRETISQICTKFRETIVEIPVFRPGKAWEPLLQCVARLYCVGAAIDWQEFDRDYARTKVVLPTYPFQRKRYWLDPYEPVRTRDERCGVPGEGEASDPLEGKLYPSPLEERQFEYRLSPELFPELQDNQNVLHVGYYHELLCRAIKRLLYGAGFYTVKGMEFLRVLMFEPQTPRRVSLVIEPKGADRTAGFQFYSLGENQTTWHLHARGKLQLDRRASVYPRMAPSLLQAIKERCPARYTHQEYYRQMEKQGFFLGNSVKRVDCVWQGEREVLARLQVSLETDLPRYYGLGLHPGILDACAQLFLLAGSHFLKDDELFMVVKIDEFTFDNRNKANGLWCHLTVDETLTAEGDIRGEYLLFDDKGYFIAQAKGKSVKIITKELREEALKVFHDERNGEPENGSTAVLVKLQNCLAEEQLEFLQVYLQQVVASLLKMSPEELSPHEPIRNLGIDSLVGFELKKIIEKDLRIDFKFLYIIEGPSIKEMAGTVLNLLPLKSGAVTPQAVDVWYSRDYKLDLDSWFLYRKNNSSARLRLFCFPYGVKGASLFRDWQANFPDTIEICPVQLPGKENRIVERPINNLPELLGTLSEVLAPLLDRPYAFYGHSIGALFAYIIARGLWQTQANKPKHLFVGAYTSPSIYPNPGFNMVVESFKYLGFDDIPTIQEIAAIPPEKMNIFDDFFDRFVNDAIEDVNWDYETKMAIVPQAFSEVAVLRDFVPDEAQKRFDVPITAFHGVKDVVVSESDMRAWSELTSGNFNFHRFTGSHFFLHPEQNQTELLNLIAEQLAVYLQMQSD